MYRAHLPLLSEDDLQELEKDRIGFHDLKDIFIQSGAYKSDCGFTRMAKIHMLSHYVHAIRELGSPDNFNTEATERLHIEYVKAGWRASNHVNELPQMTKYLQRRESWALLRTHLSSIGVLPPEAKPDSLEPIIDDEQGQHEELGGDLGAKDGGVFETVKQAANGSAEVVQKWRDDLVWHPKPMVSTASDAAHTKRSADYLIRTHGAEHLLEAVQDFLLARTGSRSKRPLSEKDEFLVWPRCKLEHGCLPFVPTDLPVTQSIRAMPAARDAHNRITRYPTFDTALFVANPEVQGLQRYTAGRVRAIFKLPKHLQFLYSKKLVYIERFGPFSGGPRLPHGLFTTNHRMERDWPLVRQTSVVPLSTVRMTCHLTPVYKLNEPYAEISSASDLLATHRRFYLNTYSSYFSFNVLDHWRRQLNNRNG
ncbi:hypothetical protein FRC12_001887 [Ceratobasidium sp. 428]|nr:hypothetical protein FRC12_001887 [Ceratobasidium sp. 428]